MAYGTDITDQRANCFNDPQGKKYKFWCKTHIIRSLSRFLILRVYKALITTKWNSSHPSAINDYIKTKKMLNIKVHISVSDTKTIIILI